MKTDSVSAPILFGKTKIQTPKEYKNNANDGKFSPSEAGKNFVLGLASPITETIKHPVKSLCFIGGISAICAIFPSMSSFFTMGFGLLGLTQTAKGAYKAAVNYKNKEYDKSEKSFNEIGQGVITSVLSAKGMKNSAKAVQEAKYMQNNNINSLTPVEKFYISNKVKNYSLYESLKENISLFTTEEGLQAFCSQFKPQNISARVLDIFNFMTKGKNNVIYVCKKKLTDFKKTAEYEKRSSMTTKDIQNRINKASTEIFDELAIPEELRPIIETFKEKNLSEGNYSKYSHKINYNEIPYRNGLNDIVETIAHEGYHSKESLKRSILSLDEKQELIKEFLTSKIKDGDSEFVPQVYRSSRAKLTETPRLNDNLKTKLTNFAEENLYNSEKKLSLRKIKQGIQPIIEGEESFINEYKNPKQAQTALSKYAQSLQTRYLDYIEGEEGTRTFNPNKLKFFTKNEAKTAFINELECVQGTELYAADSSLIYDYLFCDEEYNAEIFAREFAKKSLTKKLAEIDRTKPSEIENQAEILGDLIYQENELNYLKKGRQYYEALKQARALPKSKLGELNFKLYKKRFQKALNLKNASKFVKDNNDILVNKITLTEKTGRQAMGQSMVFPHISIAAAGIRGKNNSNVTKKRNL